ncbi:V-type ATP synthase subunit E [Gudongella sp. SC589]|jgi:vacuolar-type H+-ATPase subunit E/Vma4|uniref:V-type ATP synthase subunit E n=1 Tax=Gudongella sp. SC589 TaxID=3385990 RepID=UPI003904D778
MITVEEKLDIFHKIVYRDEEEKFLSALRELEEANERLLENKRKELEQQRGEIIRRKKNQARIERNEIRSKELEDTKARLRAKRKELEIDLVDAIVKRAKEYVTTREYGEYLCHNLDRHLKEFEDDELVLILRENDKLISENCIKGLKTATGKTFIVQTMSEDMIGGFIISDKNRTFNIDHTLRTLIKGKEYLIGKRLCQTLEGVGDLDG